VPNRAGDRQMPVRPSL